MRRSSSRPRPGLPVRSAVQSLERRVLFAAGDLDPTFSGDGIATFDYKAHDHAGDVAVQADGKVVVAGVTDGLNAVGEDFLVVRFNADGSLDTSFGGGDGFVVTDFGRRDGASAVEVLPDGRILVAGGSEESGTGDYRFALARYTAGGALDTSFGGGDGIVDLPMKGTARDMAVQSDGKIVLSGNAEYRLFGLARFNPNGTVDTSFGTGGKVTTDFNEGSTVANEVEIAPDGKIVAAGSFNRGANRGVISRYLPDGRIDTSFSGDGKFWIEDRNPIIEGMVVQGDGKIVVLEWDFTLRRIRAGGGYDLTFGNNGVARVPVGGTDTDVRLTHDLDRQPDGKLVATGLLSQGGANESSKLARLTPNGQVDTTFGDGGVVTVVEENGGTIGRSSPLRATAVAPDGKIVSAGRFVDQGPTRYDFLYDVAAYRFQYDGTVVPPPPPPPTGGAVTVQAEDANGPQDGWVIARSNGGYTGSGYLDFTASSGATATWNLDDLPGDGDYVIDVRYANGSSGTRTLAVETSPGTSRNVPFTPTGGWSTWRTISVPVTLSGGGNALTLSLHTTGSNGPNVDSITARKVGAPPPAGPTQLQAESARLVGARVSSSNGGFTGSGYADFTNASGDLIEWRPGGEAGRRKLTFRYANGSSSNRALQLSVNGDVITNSLPFAPTGSWSAWREVSVEVNFEDVENLVRLATIGNNGPNIDVLRIEDVTG